MHVPCYASELLITVPCAFVVPNERTKHTRSYISLMYSCTKNYSLDEQPADFGQEFFYLTQPHSHTYTSFGVKPIPSSTVGMSSLRYLLTFVVSEQFDLAFHSPAKYDRKAIYLYPRSAS